MGLPVRRRKIRCTGTQPCSFCTRDTAICFYVNPNKRGRRPRASLYNAPVLPTNTDSHPTHIAPAPHAGPEEDSVQPASRTFQENFDLANIAVRETPSRASPEPITDLQGQYVGPASGLSFLARVRKRLHHGDNTPSSFTFGDAPMEEYDPTPSIMISTEDSARLLEKFIDFTTPIDRIVHRPTVEEWLEEFQQTMGAMRDTNNAPAQRAILWMIFAMAQEHMIHSVPCRGEDRR